MSAEEEDREFALAYADARSHGEMEHVARILSGRLRQMDKRSRAANIRADTLARDLTEMMKLGQTLFEASRDTNRVDAAPEAHDRWHHAMDAWDEFMSRYDNYARFEMPKKPGSAEANPGS